MLHGAWPIVLVSPRTQTPHNGTAARHGVTQATMIHAPCTMVSYGAATGARPIALVSQRTQPPPSGNATHEATTAITRPTCMHGARYALLWCAPRSRMPRSPCARAAQLGGAHTNA